MSLSKCCVEGVRQCAGATLDDAEFSSEGIPEGSEENIAGIQTYVATPRTAYPRDKAVLFLTDVWGLALPNNKLLADDWARNGFKTYMPDLFDGDSLPPGSASKPFVAKHRDAAYGRVEKIIRALNEKGVTTLGGQGYCFGAKFAVHFAIEGKLKAIVVNHPSLLQVPEDLEKLKASHVPLFINSCETDPQFPKESQSKADEIFAGSSNYKRAYFAGVSHGWSVRGDPKDEHVQKAKEQAFANGVEWLHSHL